MKRVFGFLLITVLLWSCGSQFSRSKYDRHMWNRSHGHTEKTVNENSDDESKTNNGKVVEEKKATLSTIDQEETGNIKVKNSSSEEKNIAEVKSMQTSKEKKSDVAIGKKNSTQNSFLKKLNPLAHAKSGAFKKLTGNSDSDLGNILMIILLIILVILAFTLLNTLLGGILGEILGIILLVILIYFILKLLGVV